MRHVNYVISNGLVRFARDHGCGIRLEELRGIRQTSRQRKETKRQADKNRDYWPYFDLETKVLYKAALAGVPVSPGAVHDSPQAPYATDPVRDTAQERESHGFSRVECQISCQAYLSARHSCSPLGCMLPSYYIGEGGADGH